MDMRIELNESTKIPKRKVKRKGLSFIWYVLALLVPFIAYFSAFGGIQAIFPKNAVKEYKTYTISFDSGIDQELKDKIKDDLGKVVLNEKKRFEFVDEGAQFNVSWREGVGILTKYYVPISHLYVVGDDFNSKAQTIYVLDSTSENILNLLRKVYPNIKTTKSFTSTLDESGKKVGLIDAEELSYTQKLLKVSGKYFLDDNEGAIIVGLGIDPLDDFVNGIVVKNISDEVKGNNFDIEKVATLNQTGVTAITRGLGMKTDRSGDWGYASAKIDDFLKDADLTHVSNEISSVPGCIPSEGMRFCAKPEYLEALKNSGVDIVELTGNHNNDYGASYNTATIKAYTKNGWSYFGGGLNTTDASKILYKEVKGSKIAFIGYNYYDTMLGTMAIAASDRAGGNSYSVAKLKRDITNARKNADIVIVDFQFQECYCYPQQLGAMYLPCYKPLSSPDQKATFRLAIDDGADIVVGTQAHQPQTYEIYKGKVIYYGLGNLFFDQIEWPGTRQGLILTHYFYRGKVIQTKLTTTYYNADLQTYVTTGSARKELLNLLKDAR